MVYAITAEHGGGGGGGGDDDEEDELTLEMGQSGLQCHLTIIAANYSIVLLQQSMNEHLNVHSWNVLVSSS